MLQLALEYMCLFQFWSPWGVCPTMGLLGCKAVLFPVFKGISTVFFIVAVPVCIPTNRVKGFSFLHTLPAFIVCRLFDDGPSDQCEMISHCGCDLCFSDNEWCASFHVFIIHLPVFFGEMPMFWLGYLFFWYWAAWTACIFWRLILYQLFHFLLFSLILRAVFSPCL